MDRQALTEMVEHGRRPGSPNSEPTTQRNANSNERTQPQPGSTLNRAVEKMRALYEENAWVFLPLGEAGELSSGVPKLQGEQQPYSGGINKPELHPPKELPLSFEPNLPSQEHRRITLSAKDQEILALLQKSKELLGKLPHPLAQDFKDAMIKEVVHEVWTELYPELKRQSDQRDAQLDEEIIEALQDPIQREKLLEGD